MMPTTRPPVGWRRRFCRAHGDPRAVRPSRWPSTLVVWITMGLLAAGQLGAQHTTHHGQAGFFAGTGVGHQQGPFTGTVNVNALLGADRFYDAGITGTNALMANIEAGLVWSGHETLTHVQTIPNPGALGETDRHATWVAMLMAGRPDSAGMSDFQQGLAPHAQLFSGAVATGWNGAKYTTSFSVNLFAGTTYAPYRAAFQAGIGGEEGQRTADVINSSWNVLGTGSDTGSNRLAGTLDALAADNPRTLMVVSAGNTASGSPTPNKVLSAATAFNNISAGALATAATLYDSPSFFTNGGPNNYFDPVNGTVAQARQAVDIAAPGEDLATAYYGGQTGGNRSTLSGATDGPAGGPDWYSRSVRGTSFSAPIVAGGAALLYDAAYAFLPDNPDARDARVIKAVLMNSADKTSGWDNGQIAHPNGNGGVLTEQGLDDRVGTGRMNLDQAFDQYLSGTTDLAGSSQGSMGNVATIGWDFAEVVEGVTNDYLLENPLAAGTTFNATLTWFRDRRQVGVTSFAEESYDNLDLELWFAEEGQPLALVSASSSLYNNSEHFSFLIPTTSEYMLRVRWAGELFDREADENRQAYGLAWLGRPVPEPATVGMALAAIVVLLGCGCRPQRPEASLPAALPKNP